MSNTHKILLDEGQDGSGKYTYFVDLENVEFFKLSEDGTCWIQAMPIGNYMHPVHGAINITGDRVSKFADQVNGGIRGQDLAIDYDHQEGIAAGWVKQAEPRSNGLWLLVEWTKKALEHIKSKEYRYFSPEIWSNWTHPITNKKYNDVLVGGALTNMPFLKGILPIQLSENQDEGNIMDRKALEALAKKFSLKFDEAIKDEDLQILIAKFTESDDFNKPPVKVEDNKNGEDADLTKLAEDNPVVAQMLADNKKLQARVAAVEAGAKVSEIKAKLSELDTSTRALSPVAKQKLHDLMVPADADTITALFDYTAILLKDGIVTLGEIGGNKPNTDGKSLVEIVEEKITKLTEGEKGLSYADAASKVFADEPELWGPYQDEVLSNEEVK